jgi:hypothetical protein
MKVPKTLTTRIPRIENLRLSKKVLIPNRADPPFWGSKTPLFGVRIPRVGGTPEKSPYAETPGTPPDPSRGGTPPGGVDPPFFDENPLFYRKKAIFWVR